MPASRERSRIAYGLAVSQHGVASRRQLVAAGVPGRQVHRWAESGRLLRVVASVCSLGRPADRPEALMMAAALAGGPAATVTGQAGAAAWGFGTHPRTIEVVRPHGAGRRLRGTPPHRDLRVHVHRGLLRPGERRFVGPLPVASPDLVLRSLAGSSPEPVLKRYFIEAGRTGHLTTDCLERIRRCERNFPGHARLIRLVDLWDPSKGKIRSMLEGEFRLMCAEQNLPLPETNEPVGRYEVDCLWRRARLIVELDGRRFHADPAAQERDAAKTRALRAMGYRVLRFTWEDVTGRPEWVAARIRRELASAL